MAKTDLDPIPDEKIAEYRQGWEKRLKARKNRIEERKKLPIDLAYKCAKILREKFHVYEVFLIGSLAQPREIHENSDIDIAIRGLPDQQYFHVLKVLYDQLPAGVDLDLITLEDATEAMKEFVKQYGVPI